MAEQYARREFLKQGAGAAVVSLVVPSLVLPSYSQSSPQIPQAPKPPLGKVVRLGRGDAWDYVRNMFDRLIPHVEDLGSHDLIAGDYKLTSILHGAFIRDKSEHSLIEWTDNDFSANFYTPVRRGDQLTPSGISSSKIGGEREPTFAYTWRNAGDVGELERLQVYLYDCSPNQGPANYKRGLGFRRNDPWISPSSPLASRTPESLAGQTAILGTPIPWKIDFQDAAWEIIDRSGIAKVVEALEAKFG